MLHSGFLTKFCLTLILCSQSGLSFGGFPPFEDSSHCLGTSTRHEYNSHRRFSRGKFWRFFGVTAFRFKSKEEIIRFRLRLFGCQNERGNVLKCANPNQMSVEWNQRKRNSVHVIATGRRSHTKHVSTQTTIPGIFSIKLNANGKYPKWNQESPENKGKDRFSRRVNATHVNIMMFFSSFFPGWVSKRKGLLAHFDSIGSVKFKQRIQVTCPTSTRENHRWII